MTARPGIGQGLGFGRAVGLGLGTDALAVVADAAMIDSVIGLDVRRDDERAVPGARMGRGGGMGCVWGGEPAPGQREVEGRGGAFWYEVPH